MNKKYSIARMNSKELRRMQLIQVDILLELDRICRKHNIKYIIDSGTLLGAVRYGKFIPWDDDIDVAMLRSEYEKFCKVCKDELKGSTYFLQNGQTDPEYRWGYGKFVRLDTSYVRINQEHLKMKHCMFIDIFPMDGTPNSKGWEKLHEFVCLCTRKLSWSIVGKYHAKHVLARCIFKLLSLLPKQLPNKMFLMLAHRCNEQNHSRVKRLSYDDRCKAYDKRWYTQLKEISFEGHMFLAPQDTDGWLTACYGSDYMTPPPENKRGISSPASSYSFN